MYEYIKKNSSTPMVLALFVFISGFFLMILTKIVDFFKLTEVVPKFYWLLAASFLLVYVLFSSLGMLSSTKLNEYFGRCIYSFIGLAVLIGGSAYLFSGLSIFDAGSYSWIFFVLTFVFLIFLTMARTMKLLVEYAMKEEWSQPKIKKRK